MRSFLVALGFFLLPATVAAQPGQGNRLAYLDEVDPYYPHRKFPKLITPQWVGEKDVDAVVILAIDDMRDPKRYEAFLRPVLRRLKQIGGRAPVSIMTNQVDPKDPQLQAWLKEGLSLECHTTDHPCPFFKDGFAKAKATYESCVDLLNEVPGNRPVAFRMPCCDSLNTPSPRFYAEIFNRRTSGGKFLSIDSSVFNVFTADDPELPRDLVMLPDGTQRFRRYLPQDQSFVNTIEDYPYPYVIGKLCWQFPCATPSDWQAQHLHKPNNPQTVKDWEAALDCTVIKKGVMAMVFHPHGWIKNDQLAELVDYADKKYGKRVKFLNFREALERLEKNLLSDQPLRLSQANFNGAVVLDVNNDGYMDVILAGRAAGRTDRLPGITRIWLPDKSDWQTVPFPGQVFGWVTAHKLDMKGGAVFREEAEFTFGMLSNNGFPAAYVGQNHGTGKFWVFDGQKWNDSNAFASMDKDALKKIGSPAPFWFDCSLRMLDLDGDGQSELLLECANKHAVLKWDERQQLWAELPFTTPAARLLPRWRNIYGAPAGRFLDLTGEGKLDLIFSNEKEYGVYLFKGMKEGWSQKITAGKAGEAGALQMIAKDVGDGPENMGFFVHSGSLLWSNENTTLLKDLVARVPIQELLKGMDPPAMTPEASLKAIKTRPGFQVELMAAEPLVKSPVAFSFGPDGKLWVVEMGDYPLGLDGKGKPGGRVKYLEDTKGTGKYDKATLFLDGLAYPTGVLPWGKGALVVCAPDIFYAEDTDGDGKADKKEILYSGFVRGNPQHLVNGLVWGLDNWLYCANGDSGGEITSVKTGKKVNIRGHDFRIKPATGEIELQSGQTQYGRNRDDWGNWFGGNNSQPCWHFVLQDQYIARNPLVPSPDPRVNVPVVPGNAPVFPVATILPRFNDYQTAGRFTSACSPIIYRDTLFGPAFAGNSFVSEPVHNLIHREIVKPSGFSFTSRRADDEQQSEFLASADNWFRPTMIQTGPDGCLWIADMYRFVIEHPQWIPKDWQKKLDLRAGEDKGRLYRVVPVGAKPRTVPRFDKLNAAELAALLDSPNGPVRDMAQRLLVQQKDYKAVVHLEKLFRDSKNPLARLHALCTLDGMGELHPDYVRIALSDTDPGVRRHAVRLLEPQLAKSDWPGLIFTQLEQDNDAQVRLQLAFSLGGSKDRDGAMRMLAHLALRDSRDPYLLAAVFSSLQRSDFATFAPNVVGADGKTPSPSPALLEKLVQFGAALGNDKGMAALLEAVAQPVDGRFTKGQFAVLGAYLDALDQRKQTLGAVKAGGNNEMAKAADGLAALFTAARTTSSNAEVNLETRLAALALLGRGFDKQADDRKTLAEFLAPQSPPELQVAAALELAKLQGPEPAALLLAEWKRYGPTLRATVLDSLLSRQEWLIPTLDAIEKKLVPAAEIDAIRRQRLLNHKVEGVRKRAATLFAATANVDRQKLVESYRPALTLQSDPARGENVFKKTCSACHQFAGIGQAVGPDLAPEASKPGEVLLIAILDPNRAVEARYVSYSATTKSGQIFNGLLATETGSSITLTAADGKQHAIARADLDELVSTGKSLMPEGLEKDMSHQEMADLLAFLKKHAAAAKRKTFDGNNPAVVAANADGVLTLTAATCEIYGHTLVLEKQHGNLGQWHSEDDRAVWTLEVPKAGKYAMWLDWACDTPLAGNSFSMEVGETLALTGKVQATGSWEAYRYARVGDIQLPAGQVRLTFRANGVPRGALIDLKGLKLVPIK
jgi:putative membrane-bound dehydrogenase-like protein